MLALSGQVPSKVLGRGAFQDVDLNAAFAAVARSTHSVLASSDHAELVNLACKTALLERDVAHLVFPDEVQNLPAGGQRPGSPAGRVPNREIAPPADALAAAVERIAHAERPLFIVGNGARHQMDASHRPGRAGRRSGGDHLQGQGPDLRPPSPRLRRPRAAAARRSRRGS